jgi:predicted small integral membrane protein
MPITASVPTVPKNNRKNMNKPRFTVLAGIILAAAASRLIPHPPNFTPVAALALFGGASFASKRVALLVPLAAMFLSDLVLGLSLITPVVYGSFALIVGLGLWLRRRKSFSRVAFAAIASALLFFVLTNFGVWALGSWYPKTWAGLADCYVAAIPFFRNTLASSLLYSALLFGGWALAEKRFASLREPAVAAA